MSQNDDLPVGRVLTRRQVVALLGALGASDTLALLGCSGDRQTTVAAARSGQNTPAAGHSPCVVRPELTEGPYYLDDELNRSDIRANTADGAARPGAPLLLNFNVARLADGACSPLSGAQIDVWHCDALGVYSGVTDPRFDTVGQNFLRGSQVTDAKGTAAFTTIYPGWYEGRAVHIHFKIRSPASASSTLEFTSQLFFDERFTDQIYAEPPYATKGKRTDHNEDDGIFQSGGSQLMVAVARKGRGYGAAFDIALDMT